MSIGESHYVTCLSLQEANSCRSMTIFDFHASPATFIAKEMPKLRYVEIDDFNNPLCTPPSADDVMSFTSKIGEQSKAITSIRKDTCGSPVAGPSRLRAISISSDSTTSAGGASISDDDDDDAFLQLRHLQTGQGLDSEQWLSISAQCPECEHYYLQGKFFKKHVKMCLGILDI